MENLKKQALIQFLGIEDQPEQIEEIKISSYNDNIFEYFNEEYEVLTDEEADERWDEELQYYIDEVIIPEIPDCWQNYFDEESWKRDARFDGRGHAISRYDGCENEERVFGDIEKTFYIYRQN